MVTSTGGPSAIESDDVAAPVETMTETAVKYPADAYVVACFSDPGTSEDEVNPRNARVRTRAC